MTCRSCSGVSAGSDRRWSTRATRWGGASTSAPKSWTATWRWSVSGRRRYAKRGAVRARREAEARGAATAAAITTADLGQLDWPVQGRIVYQFGTATGPNNTRIPWHGIGIAAPVGTPVRAIAGGTVSLAGPLGTYLRSVLIDHGGGFYSFYGYLNDATVTQGERVIKGQVVGHVGGGSSDQGPHLHFEIRGQGGIALDPVNWLKTRR